MYKYNSRIALMIAQIFSLAVSAQTSDYQSGYKPVNGINMYYEIHGEYLGEILYTQKKNFNHTIIISLIENFFNS